MHHNKLVVAIKHNGRVLREQGDTVLVPFGSEYSIYIKNLDTVRAKVTISVDGQDATKGTSLVVPANSSIEVERFMEAGDSAGHKFKFIERTAKIENGPRGVGAEDGLIRVEYEFEQKPAEVINTIHRTVHDYRYRPSYFREYWDWPRFGAVGYAETLNSVSSASVTMNSLQMEAPTVRSTEMLNSAGSASASYVAATHGTSDKVFADVGITVPGSVSEQKFETVNWFATTGVKHSIVLKLLGVVGDKKVEKPVTVKTKLECPTCGTKNRHGTKFCKECGTGLTLVK